MIVRATENVATTVIGGSTLGRMWRQRMAASRAPSARARLDELALGAATASRPRTIRA